MRIKKLDYPYPYKAWFALSNDPDHSTLERWKALNHLIWEKLKLPFADSIFTFSKNLYLPEQICLDVHKNEILGHNYDTLHSWGDFRHSGNLCFSREKAELAVKMINKYNLNPKVWTDHSSFIGNFVHHTSMGSIPYTTDAAGYVYKNQKYSLDLAYGLGIRYMWDGKLTQCIGQKGIGRGMSRLKRWLVVYFGKLYSKMFSNISFSIDENWDLNNKTYKKVRMADGRNVYFFRRYGYWHKADIEGFGEVLSNGMLNKLVKRRGTCIMYTHLGKNPLSKSEESTFYIPDKTVKAFESLSSLYVNKELYLSSVSEMLDYVIIRDHMTLKQQQNEIRFAADGLRFEGLKQSDLQGKTFSFKGKVDLSKLKVFVDGELADWFEVEKFKKNIINIIFVNK